MAVWALSVSAFLRSSLPLARFSGFLVACPSFSFHSASGGLSVCFALVFSCCLVVSPVCFGMRALY
ncbi:hypothetical protein PS023_23775, partial [Shigella sonnei]|nr:hypothetical protein [Shigella sonnei]